jgi:hypothetical protein
VPRTGGWLGITSSPAYQGLALTRSSDLAHGGVRASTDVKDDVEVPDDDPHPTDIYHAIASPGAGSASDCPAGSADHRGKLGLGDRA